MMPYSQAAIVAKEERRERASDRATRQKNAATGDIRVHCSYIEQHNCPRRSAAQHPGADVRAGF